MTIISSNPPTEDNAPDPKLAELEFYIDQGWKIFPVYEISDGKCTCHRGAKCGTPAKHPRTANGVSDATDYYPQIVKWHETWPNANWGLATGRESNVVVVDIDTKSGGFEAWAEYLETNKTPATLESHTGGGGKHLFFEAPDAVLKNRVGFLPGVDFRGEGGHVVLPPSNHMKGALYRWADKALEPAGMPEHLVGTLSRKPESTSGSTGTPSFASALEGIPKGSRDVELFRLACSLRRRLEVKGGDNGRAEVTALILIAASKCDFPRDEALRKVEQAYLQDHNDEDLLSLLFPGAKADERIVPGGDFILDEPDVVASVWGENENSLWAEGEAVMIASQQGLGKSTIAQQLVLSRIGIGPKRFLGLPVKPSTGKVVYLAMDRPRQIARSLRRMVNDSDRDTLNEKLYLQRGPLPFDVRESRNLLADWIQEVCPDADTLVIDSLKDLAADLADGKIAAALNHSWQECLARGIDVLILHHERKAGSDSKRSVGIDHIYGSVWLTSGLGSVIQLIGEPGDAEVRLHHVKQPAEPVGPLDLVHDHSAGVTTTQRQVSINEALIEGPLSVEEIAHEIGSSRHTVSRRIKALIASGVVSIADPGGRVKGVQGPGRSATYRLREGANVNDQCQ